METNVSSNETITPRPPPRKWVIFKPLSKIRSQNSFYTLQKSILRENSEKIGTFAEDAILPKNRRSPHVSVPEVELEEVQVHGSHRTTVTRFQPVKMQPKHFPFFMIAISVIQVTIIEF